MNNTAKFVNFSCEDFTGYWDGRPRMIKAGQSVVLPLFLAQHFAKHFVNRELLRKDNNGSGIYPHGEKMTSPKKPDEVPMYMDLFNKACIELDGENENVTAGNTDEQVAVLEQGSKEFETLPESIEEEEEEEETEIKSKKQKGRPKKVKIEEDFEGEPVE